MLANVSTVSPMLASIKLGNQGRNCQITKLKYKPLYGRVVCMVLSKGKYEPPKFWCHIIQWKLLKTRAHKVSICPTPCSWRDERLTGGSVQDFKMAKNAETMS